jgi:CHASE2 domain-containing sensor protein/class 3 adenylate cyclase
MNLRPAHDELVELAEFQRRHRASLLCVVCTELAGVAKLKQQLGDAGAIRLLRQHEQVLRDLLTSFPGGLEVSCGNGAFFLVFEKPSDAVKFALELQGRSRLLGKKVGQTLQERVGVHVGEVLVEVPDGKTQMQGLNGIHVDICHGVLSVANPGQILLTRFAYDSARQALRSLPNSETADLAWANHGAYRMDGSEEAFDICEVADRSRTPLHPPKGNERVKRCESEPDLTGIAPDISETTFFQRLRIAQQNERRLGIQGAVTVATLGLVFLVFQWLDGPSYDWAYLFRRPGVVNDAVIVGIDDTSIARLASGEQRALATWNRSLYSRLLRRMTDAGAKLVVFDVLFEDPKSSTMTDGFVESATDAELRRAIEESGRTILAARWDGDEEKVLAPSPLFRRPGRWGLVEQSKDASTVIREPIGEELGVPPMADVVVQAMAGRSSRAPANSWINYYGPPKTIRSYSFISALSPLDVPSSAFSNKVVFVGGASRVAPDRDAFPSPYSRWQTADINGVEVNATRYLNQLQDDWLHRLPWWAEMLAVGLFGGAAGYLLVFLPPTRSVSLGLAGAIFVGAGLMAQVWLTQIWFPWLVLSAVQMPAAVVWAVVVRTRLLSDESRLLRKVVESRRPVSPPKAQDDPHSEALRDTRIMGTEEHARAALDLTKRSEVPPVPDHEMIRCIGKGAYGEVWLAEDIIGKFKAVKIIKRAAFTDQEPFEREFRGLQKFTPISRFHPGLVHILHIGRNDVAGFIYYIMEAGDDVVAGQSIVPYSYMPRSLVTDLERHGPTPLEQVIQYGIEIAEALAHLHRHQLIHRDIKPANIIFVNGRPKLADIGLVTDIVSPGKEITFIGTQGYMPPEGHGTASADVFSLGKLLYVAASARSVQSFPDVPDALLSGPRGELLADFLGLLLKACEPVRADRYQDTQEFLVDLREFQTRLPTL